MDFGRCSPHFNGHWRVENLTIFNFNRLIQWFCESMECWCRFFALIMTYVRPLKPPSSDGFERYMDWAKIHKREVTPRIHNNHSAPAITAFLTKSCQTGWTECVWTYDHEHFGSGKFIKWVCHCAWTESCHGTGDRGSVSGSGAVINVNSCQKQTWIVLHLVRSSFMLLERLMPATRIQPRVFNDFLESWCNKVKSLVPWCLSEIIFFTYKRGFSLSSE